MKALVLRDITCTFGSYTAVDRATLELAGGEFVAIVGPTGCGKSTLLNVAAGLLHATAGQVAVFGAPLDGINRRAGYMFQQDALLPWLTARGNVALGLELRGTAKREAAERSDQWLARVGLTGAGDRYPHQLSGGMKKRVALAQVLVLGPEILLMDEPFSALDALTRERFNAELLRLWERTGTTIVMVTHSIPEAVFIADRVVVLSPRPARIVAEIPVDLPRPRRVADLDSAFVSHVAAEVRAQLVDTTDDRIAMEEARAALEAGVAPARTRHAETAPGTPAWFDPFRSEDEA